MRTKSPRKIFTFLLAMVMLFSMSMTTLAATNSYNITVRQNAYQQAGPSFNVSGSQLAVSAIFLNPSSVGNCQARIYCVNDGTGMNAFTPYFTISNNGSIGRKTFNVNRGQNYHYVVSIQGSMPGDITVSVAGTDY